MLLKMHTFCARRSRCFLFQTQNHRSLRVTTSRKQQRTKEERSVLLYNNRWICLLPFARKPDPGRVSKQVSRCRAAAGLALWPGSFGAAGRTKSAAGRTKSAAGKPIQRAAGRKNCAIDLLRSPCSSRSVVARAALTEQRLRPLVVPKADRRERAQKLLAETASVCGFFSFTPRHQGHTRARRTDPRPPPSSRAFARAPVGGPSGAAPVGARRAPTGHF